MDALSIDEHDEISRRDSVTIARILKVNHAGEFGAICIYRARIAISRRFYPDLVGFLEETLSHEIQHCRMFREAMPERNTRPCAVMSLWGNGGWLLGFVTALFGPQGIWVCTAAVEAAVHRHLEDQLYFLRERDCNLHSLILEIQEEELRHLRHAQERITTSSALFGMLRAIISVSTDAVIWLSTWGASTRMARDLAAEKALLR